jgi:DNA helicase HerA-like ATPase
MLPHREIILVFGRSGMGKTTWVKHYIRRLPRLIICDPQEEYADYSLFDNAEEVYQYVRKKKLFRARFSDLREIGNMCFLAFILHHVYLIVDEAQRVFYPRMKLPSEFEDIIYRGRHTHSSLILVAQRPSTLDIAVRSQWTKIITFRQTEKRDIEWITSFLHDSYILSDLSTLTYLEITPEKTEKFSLDKYRNF